MKKCYGKPVKNPASIAAAIGIDKKLIKSVTEYPNGDVEIDYADSVSPDIDPVKSKVEKYLGLTAK